MKDESQKLVIKTLSKTALLQLREVAPLADRDTARPIYDELLRLSAQIARKHGFSRDKVMALK